MKETKNKEFTLYIGHKNLTNGKNLRRLHKAFDLRQVKGRKACDR